MSVEQENEIQPGLTVEEKKNLIGDLNTLAEGLGELDRGIVATMVSTNAIQKLLVDKGIFTAEELANAMKEIFSAMQASSEKALAEMQAEDEPDAGE